MLGRRSSASRPRISGPRDEPRWWDPADQVLAERVGPRRMRLPKKWKPTAMMNNVEVLDPYEGIDSAADIVGARADRVRTALAEGAAWRGPNRQLAVLRVEAFADQGADPTAARAAHRGAWQRDGMATLLETWKQRWTDREVEPGWIEVTRRDDVEVDPRIDWLRVEDHTDLADPTDVTVYQHLTLWAGRGVAVVTVRHLLDTAVDEVAGWFGDALLFHLAAAFGPDDPAPSSP